MSLMTAPIFSVASISVLSASEKSTKRPDGGSIHDRLKRIKETNMLMEETLGMIEAYNAIVHAETT